ncbi:hypothetical protein U9M48_042210 [Paspalum notatum var. saurae]|uniref:Uncharacterized protein n=1 Tax=Paspalum notatum var. saurae TaxID=547442 RepID=A0AAQ3UWI3_PASNO
MDHGTPRAACWVILVVCSWLMGLLGFFSPLGVRPVLLLRGFIVAVRSYRGHQSPISSHIGASSLSRQATHVEAPAASRNAARSVSAPPSASAAPAERLEAGLSQSTSTAIGGSCMRFPDSPSWDGDLSSSPPLRGYSWHARAPCLLICAKALVDSDSVLNMGREEHEWTLG